MQFDTSPSKLANDYINENYKYLSKDIKILKGEDNFILIHKNIVETLISIEAKLNEKKQTAEKTKKNKNVCDPYIENFRKKYSISDKDASDEKIKKFLKKYKNNELDTVRALMNSIIDNKK